MKKIISLVCVFAMAFTLLTSCFPSADTTMIRIGVMSGPTGMGMAKLMHDNPQGSEKYSFSIYSAPTNATADLIGGELDMLCLPTNTAATLKNKNPNLLSVIAINTLGSLYLLSNAQTSIQSVADLEGKTIYTSVASSTTVPIINQILKENNVNATIEVEADHQALVARIVQNDVEIAILPEPMVTTALLKNSSYKVSLNLSTEWDKISDESLVMGCLVVRNDFLNDHKSLVNSFLKEYEASIGFVSATENLDSAAQMIVDAGVLPQLPVAKKALANLKTSIVYLDGDEMKSALVSFYQVLLTSMPESIGGQLPDESFYYAP